MLTRAVLTTFLTIASTTFAPASNAQDAPPTNLGPGGLSCPTSTSCSEPTGLGNTIVGDFGYYASDFIVDLNTEPGVGLGQTTIVGAENSIAAKYGRNSIVGHDNKAYGQLGNLGIYGDSNNVNTDDANVSIVGTGNTVSGTQGQNLGLSITGGSNSVNASSGTVAGVKNSIDNMTRGTVDGYFNSVTNSSDSQVVGNGNTVSGDQNIAVGNGNAVSGDQNVTVGNGNANQANGGVVVGNRSGLGADATNSVVLGNNTYTDRSDTVDVGGRSISNVSPGTYGTDAVNLDQLQAGMRQTLGQANAYTDQAFSRLDRKINSAGAASAALGIMAGTAAGNSLSGRNRIAVGTAGYNGRSAIALGYQRTISDRMNLTVGVSFSGSERVVGAAISYGW